MKSTPSPEKLLSRPAASRSEPRRPNLIVGSQTDPAKPLGVHSVLKTLADGRLVYYDYAWKSGPALSGERGSAEYKASYKEAHARKHQVKGEPETLGDLIRKYKSTTSYTDLRDRTKEERVLQLDAIDDEFGDMPTSVFSDRRTRGRFKEWREAIVQGTKPPLHPTTIARAKARGLPPPKRKGSKAQADHHWEALNRVLNWAWDLGYIDVNPCARGGHLYHGSRRELIWTEDRERLYFYGDPARGIEPAPLRTRRTYMAGVWTGQRAWDIWDLRWSNYDGIYLRLQQHKRPDPGSEGKRVKIKVGAPFKAMLDEMEIEAGVVGLSHEERHKRHIFLNAFGRPWKNARTFCNTFHHSTRAVGISDRTFHDLRGTAVVRFAIVGTSVPQIMAITGHSLGDVKSIFEAHYLHLDDSLGDTAIEKREQSASFPTDLPTAPNRSLSVQDEKATIIRLINEIDALKKRRA